MYCSASVCSVMLCCVVPPPIGVWSLIGPVLSVDSPPLLSTADTLFAASYLSPSEVVSRASPRHTFGALRIKHVDLTISSLGILLNLMSCLRQLVYFVPLPPTFYRQVFIPHLQSCPQLFFPLLFMVVPPSPAPRRLVA